MFKARRILFFIAALFILAGCSDSEYYTKDAVLMDTFLRIKIKDKGSRQSIGEAADRALGRMRELEKKFNYYSPTSELSKINNPEVDRSAPRSGEMSKVLDFSEKMRLATKGVFDVTLGGGNKINLGGVAKGYIVDEGIEVLKECGIKNALISAGGDMYCMTGENGKPWRVGIRDPRDRKRIMATLSVSNKGVATSGAYERGPHIIDPRNGLPVEKKGKSATVIARDCMTADALATALYVLEPEEGLAIIETIDGASAYIIDENGKVFVSNKK